MSYVLLSTPILRMKKAGPREVRSLAQGHSASEPGRELPVCALGPSDEPSSGLRLTQRLQLLVLTLIIFHSSTTSRICHLPRALSLTPANSLGIN